MPELHHSVFTGRLTFLPPNHQHQSTEGNLTVGYTLVDIGLNFYADDLLCVKDKKTYVPYH